MKKLLVFCSLFLFLVPVRAAPNLTGVASVNVTSDTAATAKNMALGEARRQIAADVLGNYSNPAQLADLIKNTGDSVLTNLISSTSIDGERLSATTYSANIRMTVDAVAAKKWLAENDVQNWLGADDTVAADQSAVIINLSAGLRDWIELSRALRAENVNLSIKRISGGQITANFPAVARQKFIAAVQAAGWKSSDTDGFLEVYK
ncbi:MAG: hypothetical protein LBJ73_01745 [Rickettsiales bacterium]|jgi:hypothetical protein|nr:hypothetical protein [Rickettsiales bacterium]